MCLFDTTIYITKHDDLSDSTTDVYTKMCVSYSREAFTAKDVIIWHYKVSYGTRNDILQ